MKLKNILESIGNTPHIKINKLFASSTNNVWIKLEKQNPGGSIKDRIALAMVEDAENKGILKTGMTIVEPTSGNTGIGLAMVAAVKGYKIILVMPESMSIERRKIMSAYGASFELTPSELGMKGSMAKAKELTGHNPNFWMPLQFENDANPDIHRKSTALEIIKDFPEGIDSFITGVGTGGHISGTAEILKNHFPQLKVFAVEPIESAVINGGAPGSHSLQGIGAGFIPENLNTSILDGTISVTKEEAYNFTKRLTQEEGIFAGISTGATLAAISKKIDEVGTGKTILGFNYDTGERYLTVDGLF
ncbi:MAG: cysteine synthase A [Melioribacteraceae bacterium]|jgi:cysteine synthase A|nr:cysteine synthase A [Melioribacteraceae bacterium]